MTNEEAIDIIKKYDINGCGYCHQGGNEVEEAFNMAIKALEQESCEDTISRSEAITAIEEKARRIKNEDTLNGLAGAVGILFDLPFVKPQESNITWVTGADGAKIAFWDVPVWKVTKICEILGEPQERNEE